MSISLSGSPLATSVSTSATHDADGTIRIYPLPQGVVLTPEDAVKLANYILDSQPEPEPANDTVDQTPDSDVPAPPVDEPVADPEPVSDPEPVADPTPVEEPAPADPTPVSDPDPVADPEPVSDVPTDDTPVADPAPGIVEPGDQPGIIQEDAVAAAPAPAGLGWPSDPAAVASSAQPTESTLGSL